MKPPPGKGRFQLLSIDCQRGQEIPLDYDDARLPGKLFVIVQSWYTLLNGSPAVYKGALHYHGSYRKSPDCFVPDVPGYHWVTMIVEAGKNRVLTYRTETFTVR